MVLFNIRKKRGSESIAGYVFQQVSYERQDAPKFDRITDHVLPEFQFKGGVFSYINPKECIIQILG